MAMRGCRGCGAPITPGARERNKRVWCSEACRVRSFSASNPVYRERQNRLALERHHATYTPTNHSMECIVCGVTFTGSRRRKYCTPECSRRSYSRARQGDGRAADYTARRRALEKGAKVSRGRRAAVLERDGWVCQLCALPTRRAARYPQWDFPVIDHIIPLTDGGVHDSSNWQTAHSYCNTLKSDLRLDVFHLMFPDLAEVIRERLSLAA